MLFSSQNIRYFVLPTMLLMLSGCVSPNQPDPFERFNRSMYMFNTIADRSMLKPIAKVYHRRLPSILRQGITNELNHLEEVTRMVNALAQRRLSSALISFWRFVINSTLGFVGLFDRASQWHLPRQQADFGQTLDSFGLAPTAYIILPFLGPRTLTDIPGVFVDNSMSVQNLVFNISGNWQTGINITNVIDKRARYLGIDAVINKAFDPYIALRQSYLTRRNQKRQVALSFQRKISNK